jgi:uncharacterized protein (DUF885 family)
VTDWEFADDAVGGSETAASEAFAELAGRIIDGLLAHDPVSATWLGEHAYDDLLPDASPDGLAAALGTVEAALTAVDQVDDVALPPGPAVDLEILRNALDQERLAIDVLRPHAWDPLVANPGTAIRLLLARDFAPLAERLRSAAGRLAAVPEALAVARASLVDMPRVHVETAIGQFQGTQALLLGQLVDELALEPAVRGLVEPARLAALEALDEHVAWLRSALDDTQGDPRLGEEKYAAKLWVALDAHLTPDDVLHRAESDLARLEGEIARAAADYLGVAVPPPDDAGPVVRRALDAVAAEGPVDDTTVLALCRAAFDDTRAFLGEHELVTVFGDPVDIVEMPEIHRGVAIAYCDAPGPLETVPLPTFFAVSPTPESWDAARVASFYREYNAHMLQNLTIHEAMPGHVLQFEHMRRMTSPSRVREAFVSGAFAEGWAVYAEQLMAERGYAPRGSADRERAALAIRLQQLKMQLRMTINAILDVRVHARGMTEAEAMRLMQVRGHQEEGEAVGKWRRALLTSAQLSTYYVGYVGVRDAVADVRAGRPTWTDRQVHDAVLGHGAPPPRHLLALLGI